jgi:hypothetical protein
MARGPTRYEVLLTRAAELDLASTHDYISEFDMQSVLARRLLDA